MALTDKLTAIANAIRAKTGKTDAMTLDGMASEIEAIETGGGGDLDGFIEGTMTELTSGAGTVRAHLARESALTSADFPNATSIGDSAFNNCSALTSADFPNATSIGSNAFGYCFALTSADFPNATSIGSNAFSYCSALTSADFPNATSIGSNAFNNCSALTSADFPNATSIGYGAFGYCCSLTTIILRNETLCTLASTNVFNRCYHYQGTQHSTYNPDGLKDGYIYVPSALIEDYKAATNWSTFATQFRALEDYTVDGTITGELDPEKI